MAAHPITFGDDDPEDSWDAGDSLVEKVGVLRRWVASLEDAIAAGDFDPSREHHRKLSAMASLRTLALDSTTPVAIRAELLELDARLDDVSA